jgi:DNA-binding CsgD family transcriptional regulator
MDAAIGRTAGRRSRLVARDPERARVEAFVAALPHEARALLIRGEPGIGKTAVWRHAVERCTEAGFDVLVTRPAKDEMPLGLTGLVDLFERVELDTAALLAEEEHPFARARAVLAALRQLARDRPVVVAIDDLQWLDLASARALRYALRRLDAEPVGLLATVRAGRDAEDQLAPASILPRGRCEELEVGPLDPESLRRVLGAAVEAISRPVLRRIHEVSGGNPLYAIELARGLAVDPRSQCPRVRLRLPESLQGAIALRLEGVSDELSGLLDVVSALGATTVRALREALGDADLDALLAAAERHELLVVEEDLRVRFSHPLVGSVAYARMSPLARRALHARLAAGATDPDVHARHLALSTDEPSAAVAQVLEDAAERARDRRAIDLAAEFAGHSLRLTPPSDAAAALRRALCEIEDLAVAGEMSRALALADRLVATLPPGPGRAEVLVKRAYVEDDHVDTTEGLLRQALADAGGDDRLCGYVLDQLGWMLGMFKGDLAGGLASSREAVALASRVGDKSLEMTCTGALAYLEGLGGAPRPDLMERAVALEAQIATPVMWTSPRTLQAEHLLWAGDLAASRALFEEVREDAVRAGAEINHPYCLFDLALVECAAGNLLTADGLAREGIRAARDAEDAWGARLLLYPLSLVDAWRGRAAAARASARRRLEEARAGGERPGIVRARGVLGLLALSEGDGETAAGELAEAAALLDAMGFEHPAAFPVLPDAIEALACSGDLDAAGALTARLERQATAAGSRWALAALERARGVVLLARGEADVALAPLERAAAAFGQLGYRPDCARAVLLRGRALLRGGQRVPAADALADARRRFADMGAALWEARAASELERAAPGRSTGALTPAERRIAALVAQGSRNREIAQALFMSTATVEGHLTRTYRKLGIRSRSELVRLVSEGRV